MSPQRRPIRVSFSAKTLSGVTHLTDFVLPPVEGDDLVSEVEVVLNGERKCSIRWSVEMREGDPWVVTFDPNKPDVIRQTIDELLSRVDDEDDDYEDEAAAPPPAARPAKKTLAKKAAKKPAKKAGKT